MLPVRIYEITCRFRKFDTTKCNFVKALQAKNPTFAFMRLRLIIPIILMSISSIGHAQMDVHSHMIPKSYLAAVKALKLTDTNPLVTAILNKSAIR